MKDIKKQSIIAIAGATASGKSRLALELASSLGGEIISCDSMQIYRRMDIGTAKPTADEQKLVRHHMIDIIEPTESFSCEDYVEFASKAISDCVERGKLPIICGGTGLYLDALLRGGNSAPDINTSSAHIREELSERARIEGAEVLHRELSAVDPESGAAIHPNNVKRVIRALEIYKACGITKSELDRRSREFESPYEVKAVCLRYNDRDVLYGRIDERVELMIKEGLVEETCALMAEGVFEVNGTAAQAIGYKELFGYIRGEKSLGECVEELKTATRRYAKRQLTWFSAKPYISWVDADGGSGIKTFEEIVNNAREVFSI